MPVRAVVGANWGDEGKEKSPTSSRKMLILLSDSRAGATPAIQSLMDSESFSFTCYRLVCSTRT
jgi:hypothetical protein